MAQQKEVSRPADSATVDPATLIQEDYRRGSYMNDCCLNRGPGYFYAAAGYFGRTAGNQRRSIIGQQEFTVLCHKWIRFALSNHSVTCGDLTRRRPDAKSAKSKEALVATFADQNIARSSTIRSTPFCSR
ncbi:hypothetical protein [Pseudoxanthomonas spadix]|uniref:hypothetical protein n=1 Tax=Pseudoxanthomonas spadix TaxID=415229 RepID=UPI0011D2AF5C|nr:hypothetical protein [Pseudoxanthomonas spadix]